MALYVCTWVCAHSDLLSISASESRQSPAPPASVNRHPPPDAEESGPIGCEHPYYTLPSVLIPLGKSLPTTIHSQRCLITLKTFLYNLSKLL